MMEEVKPVLVIVPVGVIVGTAERLDETVDVDVVFQSGPTGPNEPVSTSVLEELGTPLDVKLSVEVLYDRTDVDSTTDVSIADPCCVPVDEGVTVTLVIGEILRVEEVDKV